MITEIQCPHCRMTQIYDPDMLEEDVVCSYCGRVVVPRRVQSPVLVPEAASRPERSGDAPVAGFRYVGFWPRVVAATVDGLVTTIVSFGCVCGFVMILTLCRIPADAVVAFVSQAMGLAIVWLYSALMESSPCQATLGKMVIHAKVVDDMGRRLGFGRATGRFFAKYLSTLILCIGYVMAAFDERKRGLHDMIASTYVVSA